MHNLLDKHPQLVAVEAPTFFRKLQARSAENWPRVANAVKALIVRRSHKQYELLKSSDVGALEDQDFWTWGMCRTLLPMMDKSIEAALSAEEIQTQYADEKDIHVRHAIESVTGYVMPEQNMADQVRCLKMYDVHVASEFELQLVVGKARVAGAKFLVLIAAAGPSGMSFIAQVAGVEKFQEKPKLADAIIEFRSRVTDLLNFDSARLSQTSKVRLASLITDAEALFMEKTEKIVSAAGGAMQRLHALLCDVLVNEWREFVIDAEDVEQIKKRLVLNAEQATVLPLLKNLIVARGFCKPLFVKLGLDMAKFATISEAIDKAKLQIGVTACCTGIYSTAVGNAKNSTKVQSMRQVKPLIANLKIEVPLAIIGRLNMAISKLEAETRAEKR